MERISQPQLLIVFFFLIQQAIYFGTNLSAIGYNIWVAIGFGTIGGISIGMIGFSLARKWPNEFFVLYGHKIVGKWLHIPYVILSIFLFLLVGAIQFRGLQNLLLLYFLPNTPGWSISVVFGICVALAARSGIEAIVRCAQGFFFIVLLIEIIIAMVLVNDLNFNMGIAFLTHVDLKTSVVASLGIIPWVGLIFFVLFFFPYVANSKNSLKSLGYAVLLANLILLMFTIVSILLFGPELAKNVDLVKVFKYISIADFLENLDPLILVVWLCSVFISISLSLFVALLCTAQLFSLKDYRPLTFSIVAIMIGLSFQIADNDAELTRITKQWVTPFILFMELIPIVYWIVNRIRTKVR